MSAWTRPTLIIRGFSSSANVLGKLVGSTRDVTPTAMFNQDTCVGLGYVGVQMRASVMGKPGNHHPSERARGPSGWGCPISLITKNYPLSTFLVGGLEHGFYFPIYWEESSQLTFIFFRGVAQPPTSFNGTKRNHFQCWALWQFLAVPQVGGIPNQPIDSSGLYRTQDWPTARNRQLVGRFNPGKAPCQWRWQRCHRVRPGRHLATPWEIPLEL